MKAEEHITREETTADACYVAVDATTTRDRLPTDVVACAESSRRLFELARRVAASDCTVLVSGESGVGKEVLARYIHMHSPRSAAPFVAVNCAAIPENMLEALLFGYERGAFTGAHQSHPGKFEQAQNGTLLLDEVTEMPLGLQAKLLRVLQEREVERLGGRAPIPLNVRVIATTNRTLRNEVAAGRFRADLYYRLNVFPMTLQPLRARREDILPLAMQLLARHCRPGERIPALGADAAHTLLTHTWPGNVRELDNVMQRALIFVNGGPVIGVAEIQLEEGVGHLGCATSVLASSASNGPQPKNLQPNSPAPKTHRALAASLLGTEREVILDALRADNGNRRAVAERLGISERTLRYKLARLRESGVEV
jgi:two-component system response regulator FlrC